MQDTKTRTVAVDAALAERLQLLATEQGRPFEVLFEEALEAYLVRQGQEEAEWDREALEASDEYQRTGLHLTNEEVMDWLHRRAKGEDVELPPWHT